MQIKHELVTDFKFWNILALVRNKLFLKTIFTFVITLLLTTVLHVCLNISNICNWQDTGVFSKAESDDPWMTFSAMLCKKEKLAMHACKIRGSIYVRHYIIDYLSKSSIRRKMCLRPISRKEIVDRLGYITTASPWNALLCLGRKNTMHH